MADEQVSLGNEGGREAGQAGDVRVDWGSVAGDEVVVLVVLVVSGVGTEGLWHEASAKGDERGVGRGRSGIAGMKFINDDAAVSSDEIGVDDVDILGMRRDG